MHILSRNGLLIVFGCVLVAVVYSGCSGNPRTKSKSPVLASKYQQLPAREVPDFLKGSLLELCELYNAQPFPVSSFGLVTNLRGTGDTTAGAAVYEFIRKTAITHGFGSRQLGAENMMPEQILRDKRFAIVKVEGLIPPGARKFQRFDLSVSAIEGNNTTSLAHGDLYRAELKVNGANNQMPGYEVNVWGTGDGSLFVNPAYSMAGPPETAEARASLRKALVLNGGTTLIDRPLIFRLRKPELRIARAVEYRIDNAFQDQTVSAARDEALISLYTPHKYNGDWEHFAQVAMHLFISPSPDYNATKAKQLVEEALKPNAPLLDISYCWEAMGPTVINTIRPLITHSNAHVSYAASRAAALLGDTTAQMVLLDMAKITGHEFQLSAVKTLAMLPPSPVINNALRELIHSDTTLVRLEAYRALAAHDDPVIVSRPIKDKKFRLDIVQSKGPPIIYATRTGMPRIAVIGDNPQLGTQGVFRAIDDRLTISSEAGGALVTVFYRDPVTNETVRFVCPPNLDVLVARLGGEFAIGDKPLDFDYGAVLALLQKMTDEKRLMSRTGGGGIMPVAFVLQESPEIEQRAREAPVIPDEPIMPDQIGSAAESGTGLGAAR